MLSNNEQPALGTETPKTPVTSSTGTVLNGLAPRYAEIFGEEYSNLYRENIAGRRLAHNMTIEEYRANPVILSFGGAPGPDVGQIKSIEIPVEDGTKITLNIYYPQNYDADQSQPLPCYFNVHGGGWVIGDLGDDDAFLRTVCQECNAIVIDVGYRLSPEYKFPIPITDCWDAFRWTAQNARQIGIDSLRIAVGGFSAGGHISAVICQLARDQNFPVKPCFQLLVIPVCDATALDTDLNVRKGTPYASWTEHFHAPFLSHARMTWFYKYFLPENPTEALLSDPLLSPIKAQSLANLPPALVVPAEVDVLRDEGIAYAKRLANENDAWTQLWLAQRAPHPFPHQVKAHPAAAAFRRLAIQRLGEAFTGKLPRTHFVTNV